MCCRIPKTTANYFSTTQRTTTTTAPYSGVINSLTNLFSTVLKPVPTSTNFKCVSRKGKKIEKRILIPQDYDDDEGAHVGETEFSEFPWMIEILKKNRRSGKFEYKCGGVLSKFLKFLNYINSEIIES